MREHLVFQVCDICVYLNYLKFRFRAQNFLCIKKAMLRMDRSYTKFEKLERVEKVLEDVSLYKIDFNCFVH